MSGDLLNAAINLLLGAAAGAGTTAFWLGRALNNLDRRLVRIETLLGGDRHGFPNPTP